jgi:Mce-associated membrane protein
VADKEVVADPDGNRDAVEPMSVTDAAVEAKRLRGDNLDTPSDDNQVEVSQPRVRKALHGGAARQGWKSPRRLAAAFMVAVAAALGGIAGYFTIQLRHLDRVTDQRAAFLQLARQEAVNLTTIDWQHADDDVRRIIDSATGEFRNDFEKRSQPFIDVVRQAQSTSEGTVTMAGLESASNDQARALVAVTVKTSSGNSRETSSKAWRMRIDIQRTDDGLKVNNVQFVP